MTGGPGWDLVHFSVVTACTYIYMYIGTVVEVFTSIKMSVALSNCTLSHPNFQDIFAKGCPLICTKLSYQICNSY